MINFIKIAKELYAQVNISNRDIFYSEYKLRLKENPEDLTNFPITQDNLNKYLPFLKEEEMYYLSAIANNFTVDDIKDEIKEHNNHYNTDFTLNNFKEIYSKNHNLLINYIDNLKPKNDAIIYIDRSALAIYFLLNSSLAKILSFQGKEISKEIKENLPENYKEKLEIYKLVKEKLEVFFKKHNIAYEANEKVVNKINENIVPKINNILKNIHSIGKEAKYIRPNIAFLKELLQKIENLDVYNQGYDGNEVILQFLEKYDYKIINKINDISIIVSELIGLFFNSYLYCDNFNAIIDLIIHDSDLIFYSQGLNPPSELEAELEQIFIDSGNRFLMSEINDYIKLIANYIINI